MPPHEVAAAAALHVPGRGDAEIQLLRTGLAHDTYRVTRDGRAYSLRVPAARPVDLGQDLAWEVRVLELAAGAELAPAPRYVDAGTGVLVLDWVSGRSWSDAETRTPTSLARMAETLGRLHALRVPQPARVVTPARWIEFYLAAGAGAGAGAGTGAAAGNGAPRRAGPHPALQRSAEKRLAALGAGEARTAVLCHSDLHPLNVVDRGTSIALLDFEYAHVSDPFWDLAAWSANNDFAQEHRRSLMAAYLGRVASSDEIGELMRLEWLYDYVCLLWSRLYASRAGTEGAVDILARASVLEARLLAGPG